MSNDQKIIVVTGASGQQGGAVARHLLKGGWQVRALTRNPNNPKLESLAQAGAELVQGDLDHRDTLEQALEGAYGVFSFPNMQQGLDSEIRQGKLVADVAKATGVKHFVQSSVGGVERNSGVPHFESKWVIEQYVRALGLPASFLRPAYFMENFFWKREGILNGTFESIGMLPDVPLQMIAADDIGAFAAVMFADPETYIGEALEIAGDVATEPEIVTAFAKAVGKPVDLVQLDGQPAFGDMGVMVDWFNEHGYEADIPALQEIHPNLITLETWLHQTGWGNN